MVFAVSCWCDAAAWARLLEQEPDFLEMSELPQRNDPSIRNDTHFGKLFDATPIPDQVEGFECADRDQIAEVWPEGTEAAKEVGDLHSCIGATWQVKLLQRFLHTKPRKSQLQLVSPLSDGAEHDDKNSRVQQYQTGRNLVDGDNSSKLSPYLASGVISARMVLAEARKLNKKGKLESGRDTGLGMWVQEVSLRPSSP
jgi:deoxyribodipyrimidine photo-lyase